jgi:hypothetical protein
MRGCMKEATSERGRELSRKVWMVSAVCARRALDPRASKRCIFLSMTNRKAEFSRDR